MPDRPGTACRFCGKADCKDKEHVSASSENKRQYDQRRADDPIVKLYHTVRWTKFRETFLAYNPICMLLINGKQCHEPAKVVHHLEAARVNPTSLTDPTNVAAVCKNHHRGGTSGAQPDEHYAKTIWMGQVVREEDPVTGNVIFRAATGMDAYLRALAKK